MISYHMEPVFMGNADTVDPINTITTGMNIEGEKVMSEPALRSERSDKLNAECNKKRLAI